LPTTSALHVSSFGTWDRVLAESAMQASVAFDGSRLRNLQLLAGNAVIA
jgi:hypothetical protein